MIFMDDITEEDETFTLTLETLETNQSRVSPSSDFGQAVVTITERRKYLTMIDVGNGIHVEVT